MDITVNSQSNTVAPKQAECKKMRYSIRKVATVGATSALVGTLAFLGATQVKADQVTETAPAEISGSYCDSNTRNKHSISNGSQ